jgi:hypothetical protein
LSAAVLSPDDGRADSTPTGVAGFCQGECREARSRHYQSAKNPAADPELQMGIEPRFRWNQFRELATADSAADRLSCSSNTSRLWILISQSRQLRKISRPHIVCRLCVMCSSRSGDPELRADDGPTGSDSRRPRSRHYFRLADRAEVESGALGVLDAVGPVAAKCVDRSGSCKNLATVRYAARDEVFLAGLHWNPLPIDDQGIAAPHNDHVFVVIVHVCRGCRSFTAGPKCHLAPVCSVEDVTLNAWSRLIGPRDPVCRVLHEFGEIVHGCKTLSHSRKRWRYSSEFRRHPSASRSRLARLRSGRVTGKPETMPVFVWRALKTET